MPAGQVLSLSESHRSSVSQSTYFIAGAGLQGFVRPDCLWPEDCQTLPHMRAGILRSGVDSAGGMPDLLLWNAERREAKLSEVKGPRDRLSEQQRAWAGALAAGGLHIEVSPARPAICASAALHMRAMAILRRDPNQLAWPRFT